MDDKSRVWAIAALVMGIFALLGAVCFSLCGAVLAVMGLVLAIVSLTKGRSGLAIAALAMNVLALLAAAVSMVAGAYLMMNGEHPLFRPPPGVLGVDAAAMTADAGLELPPLAPWPFDAGPDSGLHAVEAPAPENSVAWSARRKRGGRGREQPAEPTFVGEQAAQRARPDRAVDRAPGDAVLDDPVDDL